MAIIRKCRYCGAEFEARKRAFVCDKCKASEGVRHPSKYVGIKDTCPSSVYKGSGYGKKCESEETISAVCKEYDPSRGETPWSYGKTMARISSKR